MRGRLRTGLVVGSMLSLVLLGGGVLATTHHGITVDGNLSDFFSDEKIEGDQLGDSSYGSNNDLSTLYLTWDAQKLYLGFEYKAEQTAVLYLIETGKTGGVTSLCKPGYGGAFPANLQGPDFDLMIAFFAPADHGVAPKPYLYALASNGSTDVTVSAGVEIKLTETVSALGREGKVEAAIPWSLIYGLGAGKVLPGAKLQIAGAVRGKLDNDGIGDVSPDPSGGVKTGACGSAGTLVDKLHLVTVDANGDGVAESGWSPTSNGPSVKPDGGIPDTAPPADHGTPKTDQAPKADQGPSVDQGTPKADQSPNGDQGGADHAGVRDGSAGDRKLGGDKKLSADTGKRPSQDEGCACSVGERSRAFGSPALLALLGLLLLRARRRSR